MPKPKRPVSNRAREHRIEQEIVVDAYGPEERAIGWHCYLDDKLGFPFKAKSVAVRKLSPLQKPVASKGGTREAMDDWRYWVAMGYEF